MIPILSPQPTTIMARVQPIVSERLQITPPSEIQHSLMVCLDNSASMEMSGGLANLKELLTKFLQDLRRDPMIRASVLMQFGLFGDNQPLQMAGPFCSVNEIQVPQLPISYGTPLCGQSIAAVNLLIAGRKLISRQFNVDQRHGWLIAMTDGQPTDLHLADQARLAIQQLAREHQIEVYLFGVGQDANMDFLNSLAQPRRPAQKLESVQDFSRLFNWLKTSMRAVSASVPGQHLEIPALDGTLIPTQSNQ
jgi:uncharacterized protein YegL